jgi:hypothetical protein
MKIRPDKLPIFCLPREERRIPIEDDFQCQAPIYAIEYFPIAEFGMGIQIAIRAI